MKNRAKKREARQESKPTPGQTKQDPIPPILLDLVGPRPKRSTLMVSAHEDLEQELAVRDLQEAVLTLHKREHDLERTVSNLLKSRRGVKLFPLRMVIRAVKHEHPNFSQEKVVRRCDEMVAADNRRISDFFPRSWRRLKDTPDTLRDALKHPILKGRVKSYISRA